MWRRRPASWREKQLSTHKNARILPNGLISLKLTRSPLQFGTAAHRGWPQPDSYPTMPKLVLYLIISVFTPPENGLLIRPRNHSLLARRPSLPGLPAQSQHCLGASTILSRTCNSHSSWNAFKQVDYAMEAVNRGTTAVCAC